MADFKAEVKIKLKKGVADPEGTNTRRALELLGFRGVTGVASVKTFEIALRAKHEKAAKSMLDDMCRRLLANPVIHNYSIAVRKC
jgi:phosphoribosylformylglycinamidine synthase subunit PurS